MWFLIPNHGSCSPAANFWAQRFIWIKWFDTTTCLTEGKGGPFLSSTSGTSQGPSQAIVFNVNALVQAKVVFIVNNTCSGLMCLALIAIQWGFFIWKNVFISANRLLASCGWDDENSLRPWSPSFSWGELELAKCGHSPQVLFLRSQLKIAYGKLTRENVGGLGHQDCVTCIMWSVNVGKSIWYDRLCSCESSSGLGHQRKRNGGLCWEV